MFGFECLVCFGCSFSLSLWWWVRRPIPGQGRVVGSCLFYLKVFVCFVFSLSLSLVGIVCLMYGLSGLSHCDAEFFDVCDFQ